MNPEAPPWELADCRLTPEMVAALLAQQAPHLGLGTPRFLDEGWSSWAYSASDGEGTDWILRFPKRAGVARRLEREFALLPLLAGRLPLPIPRFELIGRPGEDYPHIFCGYRMLAGTPALESLDEPLDIDATAMAIGGFLAVLHESPAEWQIHTPDEDGELEAWVAEDFEGASAKLEAYGTGLEHDVREAALKVLQEPFVAGAERALVHCDFFPEHVLLEGGRAAGVIDWGDVAFGDPADDLAGLYYWQGEPMLRAGLAAYGEARALDEAALRHFADRARRICVLRAADDLEYGTLAGRPEYHRVAVRFLERFANESASA